MLFVWLGAITIGLALGLLGSGGSTLTVPILVYGLGQPEKVAIAGSLAIVGGIALLGSLAAARRGRVEWRLVGLLGFPGMVGTLAGAELGRHVTGAVQLAAFAVVMLASAALMVRPPAALATPERPPRAAAKIALDGLGVGVLTGFVGVGGGFLIIPVLVLLAGLSAERAVGTSLAIIALNAATGFARTAPGLAARGLALDYPVIALFVALGVAGTWLGRRLGRRLPQARFRQLFAAVLVVLGVFILVENL